MQQQLSLFSAPSGGGTVRAGDRVKLRRKANSAPDWKKGEVVLVDSVHPDGSVRFWSDRTEEWAYLHPGDFALTPEPVTESIPPPDDSVTPAPVTESNPDDSVTPEPVTESIPPLNDSVTPAPVTESNPDDSVTPAPVTESNPDDSVTPAPVTESNPDDSVTKAISRYRPKGTARGGEYFRFSYRSGKKVRHIHVPGGNTDSPISNARCEEIREAIALGISPEEIADCLRDRSAIILF